MSLSFGLTSGLLCHHWYNYLDTKLPGSGVKVVCRKILYDQLLFSPICIIACLSVASLIDGHTRGVWKKGGQLYLAEWLVWPPAQFVNFYFLPTRWRVIYDSLISLGYDIYTSYVQHNSLDDLESDSSFNE